jgi:hypothetical protein
MSQRSHRSVVAACRSNHPGPAPTHLFVVGMPRTGTALMRQILNASGKIAVCGETHFLGHPGLLRLCWATLFNSTPPRTPRFWRNSHGLELCRGTDLGTREKVRELLARFDAFQDGCWPAMLPTLDHEALVNQITAAPASPALVFDAFLLAYAGSRPIRGEKSPSHLHGVRILKSWFPSARFIHMMRDPRAVFCSYCHAWLDRVRAGHALIGRSRRLTLGLIALDCAIAFNRALQLDAQYRKCYKGDYLLVRYEDLVRRPREEVERIAAFAGIQVEPGMLEPVVVNSSFPDATERGSGFNADAADRWHRLIDTGTDRWFRTVCRAGMRQTGYLDLPADSERNAKPRRA